MGVATAMVLPKARLTMVLLRHVQQGGTMVTVTLAVRVRVEVKSLVD